MDIALTSTALSQSQLSSDISTAVLKKSLDTTEQSGNNFVKMMEQSVNPNLGQNIDIRL
jgi:hypothetical protein